MEVEFRNNRLKSCYDDPSKAVRRWGKQIGERYIRVVTLIMSAQDLQDLYDIRSLNFHPLRGNRKGEYALRLNVQMRLVVEYDEARRTILVKEVSKHYGD